MRIPMDAPKSSILNHMFDGILQYKPSAIGENPDVWKPSYIYIYARQPRGANPLFSGQEKPHVSEVKCYAKRHVQGSLCTVNGLHPAFSEMSFVLKSHEETYPTQPR